jgi:hypothetical protein
VSQHRPAALAALVAGAALLTIAAIAILAAALLLTSCSAPASTPAPMPTDQAPPPGQIGPSPYIDAPPTDPTPAAMPAPAMQAAEESPLPTPEAPPTPAPDLRPPSWFYVFCDASNAYQPCPGDYPIWRDADRKELFCTIPQGSKIKAPYRGRFIAGAAGRSLSFVTTGGDGGGGSHCAGWTWDDWIRSPDWNAPTATPDVMP